MPFPRCSSGTGGICVADITIIAPQTPMLSGVGGGGWAQQNVIWGHTKTPQSVFFLKKNNWTIVQYLSGNPCGSDSCIRILKSGDDYLKWIFRLLCLINYPICNRPTSKQNVHYTFCCLDIVTFFSWPDPHFVHFEMSQHVQLSLSIWKRSFTMFCRSIFSYLEQVTPVGLVTLGVLVILEGLVTD